MLTSFEAGPGRVLSYRRTGSGPLVVCIPGGPGMDPEAYFSAIDLPGHELLVLAPRGTGASSPPASPEGYKIAGYVEDVESLRAHLTLPDLTLYGNSHGGCVALAYATRFPQRVSRLVICNAPSRIDDAYMAAAAEVQQRFAEAFPDGAPRLTASEEASAAMEGGLSPEERARLFRVLMARYVACQGAAETAYLDRLCAAPTNYGSVSVMYQEFMDGLDLLADAGRVEAPALVIAGEFDVTVPAAVMRRLADALPDARYLEFAGVGHFPEVEAGAEFTAAMLEFLDGTA